MNSYNNISLSELSVKALLAVLQGATESHIETGSGIDADGFGWNGFLYTVIYQNYGVTIAKQFTAPLPWSGAFVDHGAKDDLWRIILVSRDADGYWDIPDRPIPDRLGLLQPEAERLSEDEVVAYCNRIRLLDESRTVSQ